MDPIIPKYFEVISLRELGFTYDAISIIVEVNWNQVQSWIYFNRFPFPVRRYLGVRTRRYGTKHSAESRLKMSLARKGKTYEEIYGVEEAERIRELKRIQGLENSNLRYVEKPWNKGLNKHNDPRIAKMAWERVGEGNPMYGADPWNKGLTWLEDPRLVHGKRHFNWKGGAWGEPYDLEFFALREKIRDRDGYICQICGTHQDDLDLTLHVHHIDGDKENSDPSNLVSLCQICHVNLHHGNLVLGGGIG